MSWVALDVLYEGGLQSSVDAVSDGDGGGGEGSAVSFDDQAAFSEGEALFGGRGFWCGLGRGCSWCRLCWCW